MCVTNIAKRRPSLMAAPSAMLSSQPSLISQRLLGGNYLPMLENASNCTARTSTNSTRTGTGQQQPTQQQQPAQQQQPFSHLSMNFIPFVGDNLVASPSTSLPTASNGVEEKSRPKRRRKPQKPGKTAKQNDRHFVIHNYHDYACEPNDEEEDDSDSAAQLRRRGGVSISFPLKLHAVLDQVEQDGLSHVISWQPHGRCFVIHNPKVFVEEVMPHYFRQSKLTSFQRQLNLYVRVHQ